MIIFVRFRFSEILISNSRKWVNQKRFAKGKETRGTYFFIIICSHLIKPVFSESENELDTQTLIVKSSSKNSKTEK